MYIRLNSSNRNDQNEERNGREEGEMKEQKRSLTRMKYLQLLVLVLFVISLIPILYLSFTDVATGDDYGYGAITRAAWMNTHSLAAVLAAAVDGVKGTYTSWQGTWFSVFLFSLNPEVFHPHAYWLVPWMVLILQIWSVLTFMHHFLVARCGLDKMTWLSVSALLLMAQIQCAMSPQSAIFWYVGTTHYMLPFAMGLFCIVCGDRFLQGYRLRDFVVLLILQTLLGGASYQAALLVPLTLFLIILLRMLWTGNRKSHINNKDLLLLLPFITEMAGLIISAKAPGNKSRAGADFGFSVGRACAAILNCFTEAGQQALYYLLHHTYAIIAMILIGILLFHAFGKKKAEIVCTREAGIEEAADGQTGIGIYDHPWLFLFLMICLNASAHAPALYAAVEVSGGVGNTNFFVFLFTVAATIAYFAGWYSTNGKKQRAGKLFQVMLTVLLIFLCIIGRHSIKATTDYVCYTYIRSGQAADYRVQTALQYQLLTDDKVSDPVVPMINNEQGPLQQMPVTEKKDAWSNTVTAAFYGKKSVTGMDRIKWDTLYGVKK